MTAFTWYANLHRHGATYDISANPPPYNTPFYNGSDLEPQPETAKRKRGRPRKNAIVSPRLQDVSLEKTLKRKVEEDEYEEKERESERQWKKAWDLVCEHQ